jgi:hypothetical protein
MVPYPLIVNNDSERSQEFVILRNDDRRSSLGFYFVFKYHIDFSFFSSSFLSLFLIIELENEQRSLIFLAVIY